MAISDEWNTALTALSEFSHSIMGNTRVHALFVILLSLVCWWLLRAAIKKRLSEEDTWDAIAVRTYQRAAFLVVMVPGVLIALHVLGFNMSPLFTTSGLFAVALAFAMKNISENYLAGAMIRFERTIKVGDVLQLGSAGMMMRVKKIGFRDTIVRSKDEMDILIPNSDLVREKVANFTFRDATCRVKTFVGVSYSSDLDKVREVLETICNTFADLSDQHAPEVLLTDFGTSSINYRISIWIEDPWARGRVKSDLNEAIWDAFKDAGIVMAFPQLDVHFDETAPLVGELKTNK